MEKFILNNNKKILELFRKYYNFNLKSDFENIKHFDYIFEIIETLEIPSTSLRKVSFDASSKIKGMYLSDEKKIVINPYYIEGCYKLGYINNQKKILEYFVILTHELIHAYQDFYKNNFMTDKSLILKISEIMHSYIAKEDYIYLPEEVNANVLSSLFAYSVSKEIDGFNEIEFAKRIIIYFLSLGLYRKKSIINSQFNYLYYKLNKENFDEKILQFSDEESIYYGLRKSSETLDKILTSYQTQNLCFDINKERRLKL